MGQKTLSLMMKKKMVMLIAMVITKMMMMMMAGVDLGCRERWFTALADPHTLQGGRGEGVQ